MENNIQYKLNKSQISIFKKILNDRCGKIDENGKVLFKCTDTLNAKTDFVCDNCEK